MNYREYVITGNDFLDDRRAKCESLFSIIICIHICIYMQIKNKKLKYKSLFKYFYATTFNKFKLKELK